MPILTVYKSGVPSLQQAPKPTSGPANAPTPVQQAMANADQAILQEQRGSLKNLLNKYSKVLSAVPDDIGRTSVLYHTIDIGNYKPMRKGCGRIPHEQIDVLKSEVDKLLKIGAIESSIFYFACPSI